MFHIQNSLQNDLGAAMFGQVDEEIVQQVVRIGFNINEVIQSLQNRLQNEVVQFSNLRSLPLSILLQTDASWNFQATVAYHLLLDNHFRTHSSHLKNEVVESLVSVHYLVPNAFVPIQIILSPSDRV